MADEVVGTCCAIVATACLDVIAGICIDFMSVRHACTESLCQCRCWHRSSDIDDLPDEQDPLLQNTQQPALQPPMRSHSPYT
ncbi:hypothetical protein EV363DRAFT_1166312 [Boletus edulis]|nr:hypothetical protein EV363DRAFT_1166312 [Boletus edulis]